MNDWRGHAAGLGQAVRAAQELEQTQAVRAAQELEQTQRSVKRTLEKQVPPYVQWPGMAVDAWGLQTLARRTRTQQDLRFWAKVYQVAAQHAVDDDAARIVAGYSKRVARLTTALYRPYGPVSQRTRSRRWRAGTRKTKRHAHR